MTQQTCLPHTLVERSSAVVPFFHRVAPGTPLDVVLTNAYWAQAWRPFLGRALSTVDLYAEDGAWEATVRVLSIEAPAESHANLPLISFRVLSHWTAPVERNSEIPEGVRIEHLQGKGWRAVAADGNVVRTGLAQESEAIKAAQEWARRGKKG